MIGVVHVILAFNPNNNCSVSSALVLASLHLSVLKLRSFYSRQALRQTYKKQVNKQN